MTAQAASSIAPSSSQVSFQRSPWHSPVPYLFGGLAAMLGLIAFALLILACSYWKLSGDMENEGEERERDLEAGDSKPDNDNKEPPVFEEKYLVIMAGQAKPTFLATPASSRASSFGSCSSRDSSMLSDNKSSMSEVEMMDEKEKHVMNTVDQDNADQVP